MYRLGCIRELASTVSNSTLVNTLLAASSSERPNFFKRGIVTGRRLFWWGEAPERLTIAPEPLMYARD